MTKHNKTETVRHREQTVWFFLVVARGEEVKGGEQSVMEIKGYKFPVAK